MAIKLRRKTVIGIKQETTQNTPVAITATDYIEVFNIKPPKPMFDMLKRDYKSTGLDSRKQIAGMRWWELGFSAEIKGSGVAGTAYAPLAAALEACAWNRTVHSGVEAMGAAVANGANLGVSPAPVIEVVAPAWKTTSGIIELTLVDKVITNPESAIFQAIFTPNDGSAALTGQATVTDTDFTDNAFDNDLTGLQLTTNDPDADGVGSPVSDWRVGDRWTFTYTSASQVDVTFDPVSDPASANFNGPGKSCSIECYIDSIKHILSGCLGDVGGSGEAGKIGMLDFTFYASYAEPAAGSPGTQTPNVTDPPILQSSAFSIGAYNGIINKHEWKQGNVVAKIPDTRSVLGLYGFIITDRNPTGSIDPHLDTVANHNPWSRLAASSEHAMTIKYGGTAGNIVRFTNKAAQYMPFDHGEREGIATLQIPLQFNGTANDWGQIIFE